ncbi:uncharacterized protein LOC122036472 [Zingiber officinale]|uniref:Pollen Ole e 1 allergen and extensin family protein n=1 Tax=Zingiber officinale TaxID=94328 RepID=A0A8J5LSZ7_ZINOF|nr:uncharacterized protein LOC122036472 [Zingiber officinale]KAG6537674.1 hypothetical protein ZIOFF_002769 [Zingiber officinale]
MASVISSILGRQLCLVLEFLILSIALCPTNANATAAPAPPPAQLPVSSNFTMAAEGVVYCRCYLPGYVPSLDAAPLRGVVVLLRCNGGVTSSVVNVRGVTDRQGYFYLQTQLRSKYLARYCRVFVVSSPVRTCTVPQQYKEPRRGKRDSSRGISLIFEKKLSDGIVLYSGGFIELGPSKSTACRY